MQDYDVVTDVLQKHKQKLQDMIDRNLRSEYVGLNIMDDIRLQQISEIDECLWVWETHREKWKLRQTTEN